MMHFGAFWGTCGGRLAAVRREDSEDVKERSRANRAAVLPLNLRSRCAKKRAARNYLLENRASVLQSRKSFCRVAVFDVLRAAPRWGIRMCDQIRSPKSPIRP